MADAAAVTLIRIVMEKPALGRRVVTTVFPPSLQGAATWPSKHSCAPRASLSNPVTPLRRYLRQQPHLAARVPHLAARVPP
jgi:hypothetical protein